jgi:hypothetical protein
MPGCLSVRSANVPNLKYAASVSERRLLSKELVRSQVGNARRPKGDRLTGGQQRAQRSGNGLWKATAAPRGERKAQPDGLSGSVRRRVSGSGKSDGGV